MSWKENEDDDFEYPRDTQWFEVELEPVRVTKNTYRVIGKWSFRRNDFGW